MPLWEVEVFYRSESWGRESTVTATVAVGAETRPAPGFFSPISFTGLRVEVRINKSGGLSETWRAESIASINTKPATDGKAA